MLDFLSQLSDGSQPCAVFFLHPGLKVARVRPRVPLGAVLSLIDYFIDALN